MKNKAWTPEENRAVCALYFTMLDKAVPGEKYNKAALIRVAQDGIGPRDLSETCNYATPFVGLLNARSRGSIEAKLMNCSAAHADLESGAVTMDGYGYRALSNYQAALRDAMYKALQRRDMADAFNSGTKASL